MTDAPGTPPIVFSNENSNTSDRLDALNEFVLEEFEMMHIAVRKLNTDTERLHAALRLLDNPDVNKILGPTAQEKKAAKTRVEILNSLAPLCDFGSGSTDPGTVSSRKSYNIILDIQSHYERKYC